MKESYYERCLDEESRKALIAYRMQRTYDTMKEAEVMGSGDFLLCCCQPNVLRVLLCYNSIIAKE